MKKRLTLEEYRQKIKEELISKGIKPPEIGGQKEAEMYQKWLEGFDKLYGAADEQ